jgi:uncharacterized membrane protein
MKPWFWCAALLSLGACASLSAAAPVRTAERFLVVGNEPFWSLSISKQGIVYRTPDAKPRTFAYVAPISAQGRMPDTVRVYRLQGNNTLVLRKVEACSDTMSDKVYPYSATLILGNVVRDGCAEVGK